jgi:hypothetical protein
MSTVGQTRRGSLWWLTRAILGLVVAGIVAGIWCVYEAVSLSLDAERGLHATRMTTEAVEEYVAHHDGAWPRSWTDLEQTGGKVSEVYLTGGREHVADYSGSTSTPIRIGSQNKRKPNSRRSVQSEISIQTTGVASRPYWKRSERRDSALDRLKASHAAQISGRGGSQNSVRPRPARDSQPATSSFISRTARSNPTITARATMLWPMLSSLTPAMRATGTTLR